MQRIGIITCSNITNDFACASFFCLADSHAGKGTFARYAEGGGVNVVGIISCSGCPTLMAPEKIIRRVRTLVASGVDAIHFSNCMEQFCPFKNKYESFLKAEFPDMEFVAGTHEDPPEEVGEIFGRLVHDALCQRRTSMADLLETLNQHEPGE